MVQVARQFFTLLTLAFGTFSAGYAAPIERSPPPCWSSLTSNFVLSARPVGSTSNEHPLQLVQTSSSSSDYVLAVCPGDSCAPASSSLDWGLTNGALIPHTSTLPTIDLPIASNGQVTFRMTSDTSQTTAREYCITSDTTTANGFPGVLSARGFAAEFWLCDDTTLGTQVLWWHKIGTTGCTNVNVLARAA